MATPPAFIECRLRGGGKARIRADAITGVITLYVKENAKDNILVIRLHIGHNIFYDVKDESLDSVWNKMAQALRVSTLPCIGATSANYVGHEDYSPDSVPAGAPRPRPAKLTPPEEDTAGGELMGLKRKSA